MVTHIAHLGSHYMRALLVVFGGTFSTAVAGVLRHLGVGTTGATTIDLTAILVVAGIIGPAVWWLQGKLTRLQDSVDDFHRRMDGLACQKDGTCEVAAIKKKSE